MLRKLQSYVSCTICLTVLLSVTTGAVAGDWPQQRYNNAKTAVLPKAPPTDLKLIWSRELGKPKSAWPSNQDRLQYDASYHPIIAGKLMFVGSMINDCVTAYDTATGAEKWQYRAEGPVRFAPMHEKGRLYFTSDDGHLYCLTAADGKLVWKFRGGINDRVLLGNERLISTWPARTSAMVCEGRVYFGAGIWPFMGAFLHCLDAETGKVIWTESGLEWRNLPHGGATSFSSMAPQGYIAVDGDNLYVPCGRAVPAVFDRKAGQLIHFKHASGKSGGGALVTIFGDYYWLPGFIAKTKDGKGLLTGLRSGVFAEDAVYTASAKGIEVLETIPEREAHYVFKDTRKYKRTDYVLKPRRVAKTDPAITEVFFKAGSLLYGAGDRKVAAVDVSKADKPKVVWTGDIDGKVWTMITGDDKVVAVTLGGEVFCYGKSDAEPVRLELKTVELKENPKWGSRVKKAVEAAGAEEGYCVQLGIADGGLTDELVRRTRFHIAVVDSDAGKIAELRKRMEAAGLYGRRICAFVGAPAEFPLPRYLANLIVSPSSEIAEKCKPGSRPAEALRPYGGVFCVADGQEMKVVAKRQGPLPGAGAWTHQYGDSARTLLSKDTIAPPLGMLWFGGVSNEAILPRHGHGPSPQVVGGRLFIEGRDILRSIDVYTGRLLWQREIKDLGKFYDNVLHHPGAGQIGGNYISLPDGIYVITPDLCRVLDPASGKTSRTLKLDEQDTNGDKWGWITIDGDLLAAAVKPLNVQPPMLKRGEKYPKPKPGTPFAELLGVEINARYASSSKKIVVMDRKTGKKLWSREAKVNFRHNAILLAGDKLFCIDAMSKGKLRWIESRKLKLDRVAALYALDARTGEEIWKVDDEKEVYGTWLAYSHEHDLLIQAGSSYRDRAFDEARTGITVYRAKSGKVVWSDPKLRYDGPLIVRGDRLITNGSRGFSVNLLTGGKTGWAWERKYGCNTAIGSTNMLTFRSGAAGYYDLKNNSGTGNFGGFKSSCTSNLIPADGVLSAPDYTRTCICSYQNQTSLALVPMKGVEIWTYGGQLTRDHVIGLNFGAPGDRLVKNGTYWLDVPEKGFPKPKDFKEPKATIRPDGSMQPPPIYVFVEIDGKGPECFNHHSSTFVKGPHDFVAASGLLAASTVSIETNTRPVAVRLYFTEPDVGAGSGQRVFSVSLGGIEVLKDFDPISAAGGPRKIVAKEFKLSKTDGPIEIELKASAGKALLCGVELVAEKN